MKPPYAHLLCLLLFLFSLTSCKKEEICPNGRDSSTQLKYSDPWVIAGPASLPFDMELTYPISCEDENPYRGNMLVEITNPKVVPGLKLFVEGRGIRDSAWFTSTPPPASGKVPLRLVAEFDTLNGQPILPPPGTYQVNIFTRFAPPVVNTDVPTFEENFEVSLQIPNALLDIFIFEPSRERQYPSRPSYFSTYPIEVKFQVQSQTSELSSVSYKFDDAPWVVENFSGGVSNFEFSDTLDLLPPFGGRHDFEVRATTLDGQSLTRTETFTIPFEGNNQLEVINWDGGGDGINWSDPLNWEGDLLPNLSQRAVINLSRDDKVVLQPSTFTGNEEFFDVGAFNIKADLVIRGEAVLRLHSSEDSSTLEGSLRFIPSLRAPRTPRISARQDEKGHFVVVFDTLYLADLALESTNDNFVSLFANGLAYDGPEVNTPNLPRASFIGRTFLSFRGGAKNLRPFHYFFESSERSGSLVNSLNSTWLLSENSRFQASTGEDKPDFVNFGKIEVERNTFGSTIEFENVEFSRSIPNQGFHDTTGTYAGFGEITLKECSGMMNRFRTSNTILMKSGAIGTDGVETPKLRLEGEPNNIPVYYGAGDLRGIREVELYYGLWDTNSEELGFSINGPTRSKARKLTIGFGSFLRVENAFFHSDSMSLALDTLLLYNGAVIITENDSLKLEYLDWQSGSFANHSAGTLHVRGNAQGASSSIRLPAANSGFAGILSLGPQAVVDWSLGQIAGNPHEPVNVNILSGAVFRMGNNQGTAMSWNMPESGQSRGYVRINNRGLLQKVGSNVVEIQGCLRTEGGGQVDMSAGNIDFLQTAPNNFTCN